MAYTPEGDVEEYFIKRTKQAGGYPMKFISPSLRGVPDQILLYKGQTYYAEIKAPHKKARKSQEVRFRKFKKHGVHVYILDTREKIDDFIQNTLHATITQTKKQTTHTKKGSLLDKVVKK